MCAYDFLAILDLLFDEKKIYGTYITLTQRVMGFFFCFVLFLFFCFDLLLFFCFCFCFFVFCLFVCFNNKMI